METDFRPSAGVTFWGPRRRPPRPCPGPSGSSRPIHQADRRIGNTWAGSVVYKVSVPRDDEPETISPMNPDSALKNLDAKARVLAARLGGRGADTDSAAAPAGQVGAFIINAAWRRCGTVIAAPRR